MVDVEPLDAFHDDLFAGQDDYPGGLYPHAAPPQQLQEVDAGEGGLRLSSSQDFLSPPELDGLCCPGLALDLGPAAGQHHNSDDLHGLGSMLAVGDPTPGGCYCSLGDSLTTHEDPAALLASVAGAAAASSATDTTHEVAAAAAGTAALVNTTAGVDAAEAAAGVAGTQPSTDLPCEVPWPLQPGAASWQDDAQSAAAPVGLSATAAGQDDPALQCSSSSRELVSASAAGPATESGEAPAAAPSDDDSSSLPDIDDVVADLLGGLEAPDAAAAAEPASAVPAAAAAAVVAPAVGAAAPGDWASDSGAAEKQQQDAQQQGYQFQAGAAASGGGLQQVQPSSSSDSSSRSLLDEEQQQLDREGVRPPVSPSEAAAATAGGQPIPLPGCEDSLAGDEAFASPNSSWHSCMTSASQCSSSHMMHSATSHLVASRAASGLFARPLAAQQQQRLAVAQPCSSSNTSSSNGSGGRPEECVEPAAVAAAACEQPAGHAPSEAAAHVDSNEDSTDRAAAAEQHAAADAVAAAAHEPAAASDELAGGPAMAGNTDEREQQQEEQQEEQQEQEQQRGVGADDAWQDVLAGPSPGSSPPSPGWQNVQLPCFHPASINTAGAGAAAAGGDGLQGLPLASAAAAAAAAADDRRAGGSGAWPATGHPQRHSFGRAMYAPHASVAASSCMLRQSELVDLSLSTSLHPGLLQQQQRQQAAPGWLTAHQQLPPAAARAVEAAVVALNDSYFYHGRQGPPGTAADTAAAAASAGVSPGGRCGSVGSDSELVPQAAAGPGAAAAGVGAAGASGVVGFGIRRTAGQLWNQPHTQPQRDQQSRHRLRPSGAPGAGGGPFGWPGPGGLGQWLSSAVQQPLAAAATRAAAEVGQRLGAAAAGMTSPRGTSATPAAHASGSAAGGGQAAAPGGSSGSPGGFISPSFSSSSLEECVLVDKTPDLPQSLQEQEDEAFRGLLFLGGRDSHGRPVVVINTDAIPAGANPGPRDAALAYLLKRLGPIVCRGPYVLVMVAFQSGPQFRLLPGVWCVRVFQSLPRAFRKNVKHVLLLQPSLMVRAGLVMLYPFISSKAHAKIKQVNRLLDIDAATAGEVQVPHLGEAFLTTLQQLQAARAAAAAAAGAHYEAAPTAAAAGPQREQRQGPPPLPHTAAAAARALLPVPAQQPH